MLGNDGIDRREDVGALREGKEGGEIRHALRNGAWHLFISSAGFIFGVASAASSRGHQAPAERERSSRLHVVIGPNVVEGFLFNNLNDSVIRRYFRHQECSLR